MYVYIIYIYTYMCIYIYICGGFQSHRDPHNGYPKSSEVLNQWWLGDPAFKKPPYGMFLYGWETSPEMVVKYLLVENVMLLYIYILYIYIHVEEILGTFHILSPFLWFPKRVFSWHFVCGFTSKWGTVPPWCFFGQKPLGDRDGKMNMEMTPPLFLTSSHEDVFFLSG